MFNSARPMGHFSSYQVKMAQTSLNSLTMELGMLKRQAINAEIYLECLNKLVEPLAVVQGPMGLRTWLSEVQHFMGLMKQRSFQGLPLSPRERQVIQWYSVKWRELRGGPCDMGRPEAQIVLISLNELCRF